MFFAHSSIHSYTKLIHSYTKPIHSFVYPKITYSEHLFNDLGNWNILKHKVL